MCAPHTEAGKALGVAPARRSPGGTPGADSDLVIKTASTPEQASKDYGVKFPGAEDRPPRAPDLTDELLTKSRRAQAYRLMASQGRASTFLTGPFGNFTQTRSG